jgi:RNA polymerase sigma factor (sigma-70 family)
MPQMQRSDARPENDDLSAVMERLLPRLRFVFARYRLSHEDAEDLLQNALVRVVIRWPEIENKEGWLYGTVVRMCRIFARTRAAPGPTPTEPAYLAPPQENSDHLADLTRLCRILPQRQRQALILRFRFGLTPCEIAPLLGVRATSVMKMISRAIARIRHAASAPASDSSKRQSPSSLYDHR